MYQLLKYAFARVISYLGEFQLNKSGATNLISLFLVLVGYFFHSSLILSVGLFAISGAITNWLAIHMLFEKVPGLYGSGVIPARFEDFKSAILNLIMEQFFTAGNIERFLSSTSASNNKLNLSSVIDKVDLSPAFDSLIETVEQSSFGGMLAMFGGTDALQPLKATFIQKMKISLEEITQKDDFNALITKELEQPNILNDLREKIQQIVLKRLDELTPQMVKEIVQQMIRAHLGWLVVWGGVFGGVIGLIAGLLPI